MSCVVDNDAHYYYCFVAVVVVDAIHSDHYFDGYCFVDVDLTSVVVYCSSCCPSRLAQSYRLLASVVESQLKRRPILVD